MERQAVGNIDFNQNMLTQVFTPYQGRIINAYPNIGDKVEKDQVLFTIDSPDLLAAEFDVDRRRRRSKAAEPHLDARREDEGVRRRLATGRRSVDIGSNDGGRRVEVRARRGSHLRQDRRGNRQDHRGAQGRSETDRQKPDDRLCHDAQRGSRTFRAARRGASAFHRRRSFDHVDVRERSGKRSARSTRRAEGQDARRGLS